MALLTTGVIAAGAALGVLGVAYHEQRGALTARARMLDGPADVLAAGAVAVGADGFPRADGYYQGRTARLGLIPDSLTFRRLPQLWLSVTIGAQWPGLAAFDVIVRPTGAEFYSLGGRFPLRLEAAPDLPEEVFVRGQSAASAELLHALARDVGAILADPRAKEITVSEGGVRLIYQAFEGERGAHLLLRQARFGSGGIAPELAVRLLDQVAALAHRVEGVRPEAAA